MVKKKVLRNDRHVIYAKEGTYKENDVGSKPAPDLTRSPARQF